MFESLKKKLSANIGGLKQIAKGVMVFGVFCMIGVYFVQQVTDTFDPDSLPYNIGVAIQNVFSDLVLVWLGILVIVSVMVYILATLEII